LGREFGIVETKPLRELLYTVVDAGRSSA
jgi:hypothetical protein